MEDKRLQDLRKRLEWYILDCPYDEYNEQEVNYLIEQLKQDVDVENEIQSSYASFTIKIKSRERNAHKKKVVIASVVAVVTAASMFLMLSLGNESIAGLKDGIFNFIQKNEDGMQFFISPDKVGMNTDSEPHVYNYPDIPEEILKEVWLPAKDIGSVELVSVSVYEDDQLLVRFHNKENSSIDFCYSTASTEITDDMAVVKQIEYRNILIKCFEISVDDKVMQYRFCFEYAGDYYYIESGDIKTGELLLYGFIDFLLS